MPARLPSELRARIEERMRKAGRFRSSAEGAFEDQDYETCASRSYYAAFHAATALLMAHGKPEAENWQSHNMVINECSSLGTKRNKWFVALRMGRSRDFTSSFHSLYTLRREADYVSASIDRPRARVALRFVIEFLVAVNERIP